MKYEPVTVNKNVLENTLEYQGTPVLRYTIEYPSLSHPVHQEWLRQINAWYRRQAEALQKKYETDTYREAAELYETSRANEFPFHMYDAVSTFDVTYNQNGVLSLYRDDYIFSGGAHGGTIRKSETWNLKTGDRIYLYQYTADPAAFRKELLSLIGEQIRQQTESGEGMYFENYPQLISEHFNPESFYLTPEGLVIYYQEYDIAPYASGIPTFTISL